MPSPPPAPSSAIIIGSPSGAAIGISCETRARSDSGSPIQKSRPSGPAISEAKNSPRL